MGLQGAQNQVPGEPVSSTIPLYRINIQYLTCDFQAVKNEKNDAVKLKSLKSEVEELRAKLAALEAGARKGGDPADAKALKALRGELAERELELKREIEAAKLREEELSRVQAETRARLDDLKKDYDESQYNLGNARLAWKALVKNLKHEENQNKELSAEIATLKDKLQQYAQIDDVVEREKTVAAKEVSLGNIGEYETKLAALKAEYESKVDVVRAAEQSVAQREKSVSEREHAVQEREAFLLKRDSYYQSKQAGHGIQSMGRALSSAGSDQSRGSSAGRRGSAGRSRAGGAGASFRGRRNSAHLEAPSLAMGTSLPSAMSISGHASAESSTGGRIMGQHVLASMAGLGLSGERSSSASHPKRGRRGSSFRGGAARGGAARLGAVR